MNETQAQSMTNGQGRCLQGRVGHAFTLVEILVVIVIGLVILSIAVPAFQTMAYSSNQSLAVNGLQAGAQMARDTAVISGQDGAVVFVFEPDVGRMQIIPAVKVGTIRERTPANTGTSGALIESPYFDRDVFVPSSIGQTIDMPRFWNVRGFAPAGSMIDYDSIGGEYAVWYTSVAYGGTTANDPIKDIAHWLFPESGFFPHDAQISGGPIDGSLSAVDRTRPTARQSFMIRFEGRTGILSRDSGTALFVSPRNSQQRPYGNRPALDELPQRVDLADSIAVWAARTIETGDLDANGFSYATPDDVLREQLIGNQSNDTILVKPVTRLALYDERKLAVGAQARGLNRETNTLYEPIDQESPSDQIGFDKALFGGVGDAAIVERIDQWINGNTTFVRDGDTDLNFEDEPLARIYLIQPYTGELQEVLR